MRRSRGLLASGLVIAALTLAPERAAAWTSASVRSGQAQVELTPDGRARVELHARLRVDGGWLEGFELEGIDPDATLDPEHPPTFRDVNGVPFDVEVTPRNGGRVSFRFPRRSAPRRGEYEAHVVWLTALDDVRPLGASQLEAHWVFPAWRFGLDGVEVRWVGPGLHAPAATDEMAPIDVTSSDEHGESVVAFRRAHLPRTSSWETSVIVDRAAWPHPVRAIESETAPEVSLTPPTPQSHDTPPTSPTTAALAAFVAAGSWVKRRSLRAVARARALTPADVLVAPEWLRTLVPLAAVCASLASQRWALPPLWLVPAVAIAVGLAWQRPASGRTRPRIQPVQRVTTEEIRRARSQPLTSWAAPEAWLDPSRLGFAAVALAAGLALHDGGEARAMAALLLALVGAGTTARMGDDGSASIRTLSRWLERLRVPLEGPQLAFALVRRSHEAAWLRIDSDSPSELRFEVVADGDIALRVSARPGSDAEPIVTNWSVPGGTRTTHATRIHIEVPLRRIATPGESEGETLHRTIAELHAKTSGSTLADAAE